MAQVDPRLESTSPLSHRQCQVLVCMAKGMSNTEIAESLYLSVRSVEREIARARTALDVDSRELLLLYAYREGVIRDEHLANHRNGQSGMTSRYRTR